VAIDRVLYGAGQGDRRSSAPAPAGARQSHLETRRACRSSASWRAGNNQSGCQPGRVLQYLRPKCCGAWLSAKRVGKAAVPVRTMPGASEDRQARTSARALQHVEE